MVTKQCCNAEDSAELKVFTFENTNIENIFSYE